MSLVIYSEQLKQDLEEYLGRIHYSDIFWLADSNTAKECAPHLGALLDKEKLITIPAGEAHKSWESCQAIWNFLLKQNADRNALLINLGGGMITDLGGFAASVYKRGIRFLHLPTTLLGMVDAAIGGKTGIDYQEYKNIIGSFAFPEATLVFPGFLHSLPEREIIAGYAEVLKYALIQDTELWLKLKDTYPKEITDWLPVIRTCIDIKNAVVEADPKEQGLRKILNFGHTIGHALESYFLHSEQPILHGEAVAAGMLAETYLSTIKTGLPEEELNQVAHCIKSIFPMVNLGNEETLLQLMRQDKKNTASEFRLVLLEKIGQAKYDIPCSEAEILQAFEYYRSVWNG